MKRRLAVVMSCRGSLSSELLLAKGLKISLPAVICFCGGLQQVAKATGFSFLALKDGRHLQSNK